MRPVTGGSVNGSILESQGRSTIHEDNAREYLSDHIHLNVEGRKKVAERFVYALNYFDDMQKKE